MQRVVRLSFVGLLAIAGASLTACGDKVTVPAGTPTDSVVHSVTVSPPSASLKIGDKFQFGASVDAGPGITDRTVTWSSSNTAVATVDATGLVTAVSGGNASIVAKSKADPNVSGAASVTVQAEVVATVTLGQINQTACDIFGGCTSVPANLGNVSNQLDVTVNLDPGTQKVTEVDLVMNCGGTDTVVARQTLAAADVAPVEDASAPITMSFNTAAFNAATGAVAFKNGACTLKAKAITSTGTQVASSLQSITLNNLDTVSATMTTTPVGSQKASATDATGLLWRAGTVTVTAVPVIYTPGVTAASGSVSLVNISTVAGTKGTTPGTVLPCPDPSCVFATQTNLTPTTGVITATFPKDMSAAGVDSTTIRAVGVAVTTVTSAGNPGPAIAASTANIIRLDNLAPDKTAPTVDLTKFNATNNWLGKNFVFSTASGSVTLNAAATDNGGVDVVTFTTQSAPFGTTTWTTFSAVTALGETSQASSTGSYILRLNVCDALNNCTNTANLTPTGFGVDLTPPSVAQTAGPTDHEIFNIDSVVPATAAFNVVDTSNTAGITPSGPPAGAEVLVTLQGLQPATTLPGSKTICAIGTPTGSGSAITCKAAVTEPQSGFGIPTAAGEYTMTVTGVDQAGNQSAPITIKWYVDQNVATVSGGVTIPNPITTGSSFTLNALDNMDLAAGSGGLVYAAATFFEAGTSSVNGVAFDNVLTQAGTITVPLTTFYKSLTTAPGTLGSVPAGMYIRAVDAATNLSAQTPVAFPAANMDTAVMISNTSASNGITAAAAYAVPAADTVGQTVTLSDTLTAISTTSASPFNQVCFYYAVPAGHSPGTDAAGPGGSATGDLVKIGCTTGLSTSGTAPRLLAYSMTWSVPAVLAGTTVPIYAVGVTARGDALLTSAGSLTIAP